MVALGRLLMDDTIEGLRQTIRGYRGILEDAGVHVTHADVDEWHNSRARLLAVARVAEDVTKWIGNPPPEDVAKLSEALAAVEDLLKENEND